jgi:hypothetical protein
MEIPVLSEDLISALNKMFPLKNPPIDTPDRLIWFKAGQRQVVEMLVVSLETQIEDMMKRRPECS